MNATQPPNPRPVPADLGPLLSEAIAAADPALAQRLATDPEAYIDLVTLTNAAREETSALLDSAVAAARLAGHSWERIGRELGMSRQAAQQRFGKASGEPGIATEHTKVVSPLTSFTEMEVLNRLGRHGWHSVGFGTLHHIMAADTQQWEHLRVPLARGNKLEAAGWQKIGKMWFPWAYYARPLGIPVLEGTPPEVA
ncbi:hypothetical protein ACQCSX_13165 [Pseudarthrobacter sp. P1]|uniref:hypothetical protein n=1 Tax=Pseudarthrobacter sp. P1 TaxID=3418418 RepID=UPI003CE95718